MALASLAACSSTRVSVQPAPVWPFQQLRISFARDGALTAYYSRPESAPARLFVVVQDPPCYGAAPAPRVSTSGVLWKQLHADFAFVQFESVGVRSSDTPQVDAPCSGSAANSPSPDQWSRDIARSVAAIKRHEGLRELPTIYLGIGEGAMPAANAAARDPSTSLLVLLNGLHPDIPKSAKRIPILIVHASADARAPVEEARLLFSRLAAGRNHVAMLILQGLDHDLGLTTGRPECFDASMQQIVARMRLMMRAELPLRMESSDCERALAEFPEKDAEGG